MYFIHPRNTVSFDLSSQDCLHNCVLKEKVFFSLFLLIQAKSHMLFMYFLKVLWGDDLNCS